MSNLPATSSPATPTRQTLDTVEGTRSLHQLANVFTNSSLVPKDFQRNTANCVIALDIVARLNLSPMVVFQQLYIVNGKPSWSSSFMISMFNQRAKDFGRLEYCYSGQPGTPERTCWARAKLKATGEYVEGPPVTLRMSKVERWGSKWDSMPELMLKYRAAAFFIRTNCPEILFGLYTEDEAQDIEAAKEANAQVVTHSGEAVISPVQKLLQSFAEWGVSQSALEEYLGHSVNSISEEEMKKLREVWKEIKSSGGTAVRDLFPSLAGGPAAQQGSWNALHVLLLLVLKRPGGMRTQVEREAHLLVLGCDSCGEMLATSFLLWGMYFGYFSPAAPGRSIEETDRLLSSLPADQCGMLRCLRALYDWTQGRDREQSLQTLRDCQKDEYIAARLLLTLSLSDKESPSPDIDLLKQYILAPWYTALAVSYFWQGIVRTQGSEAQQEWLEPMEGCIPPLGGGIYYLRGQMYLHGYGGYTRDLDKALEEFAKAAREYFLPAIGMLADMTCHGFYGCEVGKYNGVDWVVEGCRRLEPRSVAMYARSPDHGDRGLRDIPYRLANYTLEELYEWLGHQDTDCASLALHAIFLLTTLVPEKQNRDQDMEHILTVNIARASSRLACAIRLAQAMADAGTFFYLFNALTCLERELDESEECIAMLFAMQGCLLIFEHTDTREPEEDFLLPDQETSLGLLAFFCLDRAAFFGEPKAQKLLDEREQNKKTARFRELMTKLNLTAPLRKFVCPTHFMLV